MSELTRCNFCSHQDSLRRARKEGKKVTVLPNDWGMGGVAEYIHPKDVNVRKLDKTERKQYEVAWYMQLGEDCCC